MGSRLAALGAVVGAACLAYVVTLDSIDAPNRGPQGAAEPDVSAVAALVASSGTAGAAGVADAVTCSRVEDIGERLMAVREREEFRRLAGHMPGLLAVELAADMAGLDPHLRYGASPLAVRFGVEPWPSYPRPEPAAQPLSWSDQDELEQLVDDGLFSAVFEHPALEGRRDATLDSADSAGERRTTTALGALLQRHGAVADRWLPHVPDDWPVGLHDLAVAVEAGVAAVAFESLLDRRARGAAATWPDGFGGDINLAQLAAYHMQPKLLRVLMARGISPAGEQPLLDDIARLPEASEHEAEVVGMLVAAGLKVRRPTTLRLLKTRHPHQSGLVLHPDAESALASPAVAELAQSLAGAMTRWQTERQQLESWRERCRAQLAAGGLATDAAASGNQLTLNAKRRHDKDLREARDRQRQRARAALEGASGPGHRDDALGDLVGRAYEGAVNRRWDEAIAAANNVPAPLREFVRRDLLSHALSVGASMEVFEALLGLNDGILPEDAILDLTSRGWKGSASVAEALLAHGLDVHHADRFGKNAFSQAAAIHGYDAQMAKFLAAQGVSPKPSPRGMDPLDDILSAMVMWGVDEEGLWLARLLVDIGAPIEPSHLELTQRIALVAPGDHAKLVRAIPPLGLSAGQID